MRLGFAKEDLVKYVLGFLLHVFWSGILLVLPAEGFLYSIEKQCFRFIRNYALRKSDGGSLLGSPWRCSAIKY